MGFTTDKKVLFVRISNPQASGQLPEMHWMAPEAADLIPLKVQPGSVGDMADFYLLDQTTGKSERVINTPWRYVQDLLYKTKTEAVNRGTGRVTFVFDRGRWRYQGEIWWPEKREPQSLGDVYDSADRVRQVNSSTPADFAPKILEIGMGEVVVWQGASGLIYSYSTNQEHWTSPFLFKGDTYAKKFNTAGDYYYLIKSNLYELKGEIHVK